MKRCINCLITENRNIGIFIDSKGICNYCKAASIENRNNKVLWKKKKKLFEDLILSKKGKYPFDGLLMMSGGKDSAFLALKLVEEYNLNLLALTIDNGFEYFDSFNNAKTICKKLKIPIITFQPDLLQLNSFYKFILTDTKIKRENLDQLCFYCGIYLRKIASNFAKVFEIPLIFIGYNPTQISEIGESGETENSQKKTEYQEFIKKEIAKIISDTIEYVNMKGRTDLISYFKMPEGQFVFPFQYFEYKPMEMIQIIKKKLNWKPIERYKKNYIASGCKLINLQIYTCKMNNLPNYVEKEFCSQIREKVLEKDIVEKLFSTMNNDFIDNEEINTILNILDIDKKDLSRLD